MDFMCSKSHRYRGEQLVVQTLNKDENFISLKNGNGLIDLFKEHNLYNLIFKIEDSLRIESTNIVNPQ